MRKSLVATVSSAAALAAIATSVGVGSADAATTYPYQRGPVCYGLSPYLIDIPNQSGLTDMQNRGTPGQFDLSASVLWSLWPPYVVDGRGSWRNLDNGRAGVLPVRSKSVTAPFSDLLTEMTWTVNSGAGRVAVDVTSTPRGPIPVPGAHCTATFTVH